MTKLKIDLKKFKTLGYAVIDIISRDYNAAEDVYKFVIVPLRKNTYSVKFFELLNIKLLEDLAQQAMQEIYKHKWIESEKAKMDIGLKIAAEDWQKNYFKDWIKRKK